MLGDDVGVVAEAAYQMIVSVIARNWNGTVRSTALGVRLRAWPTPKMFFAFFEGDFDWPAVGVTLNDLGGGRVEVGGDQRDLVAAALLGVLDEDHADRGLGAERRPQAVDLWSISVSVLP